MVDTELKRGQSAPGDKSSVFNALVQNSNLMEVDTMIC